MTQEDLDKLELPELIKAAKKIGLTLPSDVTKAVAIEQIMAAEAKKTEQPSPEFLKLQQEFDAYKAEVANDIQQWELKVQEAEEKGRDTLEKAETDLKAQISKLETEKTDAETEHAKQLADKEAEIIRLNGDVDSLTEPKVTGNQPLTIAGSLQSFLNALPFEIPKVKVPGSSGDMKPSKDRRKFEATTKAMFLHVEERNFRNQSGYDLNWIANAKSAVNECLRHDFGSRDPKIGSLTFDALPDFAQSNRIFVMVALVPGPDLPEDQ